MIEAEGALEAFLAERARLVRIGYRIIGDAEAAEDLVQEAWIRWQRADRRTVQNPAAFLTTTTRRLAINLLQSARCRRETPTELSGMEGAGVDPAARVTPLGRSGQPGQSTDIESIMDSLMAQLAPVELSALLLRKCFDYPYQQIAQVLKISAVNARQLVSRARTRLGRRPSQRADTEERFVDAVTRRRLGDAFVTAAQTGQLERFEAVLADHVLNQRTKAA
ncbi:MAG TPA: sigma-70 family RNA polymerase sigma factor [Microlunatus sp.]